MKRDKFLSRLLELASAIHTTSETFPDVTREDSLNRDVFHRIQLGLLYLTQETPRLTLQTTLTASVVSELCSFVSILAIARESRDARGNTPVMRCYRNEFRKLEKVFTELVTQLAVEGGIEL